MLIEMNEDDLGLLYLFFLLLVGWFFNTYFSNVLCLLFTIVIRQNTAWQRVINILSIISVQLNLLNQSS